MDNIYEKSPSDMLRQFAVHLDAELMENHGASKLTFDNEFGKGIIRLYELIPGLTAWIYDVTFVNEYNFKLLFSNQRPYYFGYNVRGHQLQKLPGDEDYREISQGQNFIIAGEPSKESEFVLPGGTKYECCYLIVNPVLLAKSHSMSKRRLASNLSDLFGSFEGDVSYRYFGNIDARTGTYAKIIVRNQRTDVVGQLLTEGAVMNMLASQIEAHDHNKQTKSFQPNLTKKELSKLTNLGDYVQNNMNGKVTIEDIAKHFGMSPKKLQTGMRFLYGYSVNEYISSLRMELARELIHSTDLSISEVCYRVGYSSRSYFSKIFFDYFGVLPSSYKESLNTGTALYEITYRSMASSTILEEDIEDLITIARKMNPNFDITGCLIYHRKIFFQIIEGPKRDILQLYDNIHKDGRHSDVNIIYKGFKPKRHFADWSMALLSDKGLLKTTAEGNTNEIDLGPLVGDIQNGAMVSESLWKKVRNVLLANAESKL